MTELRPVKAPLAIEVILLLPKFLPYGRPAVSHVTNTNTNLWHVYVKPDNEPNPPQGPSEHGTGERDVHVGDRAQVRKGAALDRGDQVLRQIPAARSGMTNAQHIITPHFTQPTPERTRRTFA